MQVQAGEGRERLSSVMQAQKLTWRCAASETLPVDIGTRWKRDGAVGRLQTKYWTVAALMVVVRIVLFLQEYEVHQKWQRQNNTEMNEN